MTNKQLIKEARKEARTWPKFCKDANIKDKGTYMKRITDLCVRLESADTQIGTLQAEIKRLHTQLGTPPCDRCGNTPCLGCNPCCGYSAKPLRDEDNACNGCG